MIIPTNVFQDRVEAGQRLAAQLRKYAHERPMVLALPRGGVPIGWQVAQALHAPLDVMVVRKIGAPRNPELGIGAIAEGDVQIFDQRMIEELRVTPEQVAEIVQKENAEMQRRATLYREGRPLPGVINRTVILVDDGLATGITARAAIKAVRQLGPKKLIMALPVCAADTMSDIQAEVDELICLLIPTGFLAVGQWYERFDQVSDGEVVELLQAAR